MDPQRFEQILVAPDATIRRAIEAIDAGKGAHLALVVDGERRLLGTVTDGDVRRALLHGADLEAPVGEIAHREPVTADPGATEDELHALMERHSVEQIPIVEDGRVVDVALLRDLAEHAWSDHHVVLVAGGEGRRLRPLTEETPKPMLTVGDRPLLETVLGQVKDAGFQKVFLLCNYRGEEIESYFGSGERVGLELEYVHEPEPLGSAGGLGFVRGRLDRPFVVMNADLLTTVDFGALLKFHASERNAITVGVKRYVLEVPYGVVQLEGTRVAGFEEKPELKFFVNAGVYALDPSAVAYLPDPPDRFGMNDLIEAALRAGARVGSFPVREYWLDVGHVADFERAQVEHEARFRQAG